MSAQRCRRMPHADADAVRRRWSRYRRRMCVGDCVCVCLCAAMYLDTSIGGTIFIRIECGSLPSRSSSLTSSSSSSLSASQNNSIDLLPPNPLPSSHSVAVNMLRFRACTYRCCGCAFPDEQYQNAHTRIIYVALREPYAYVWEVIMLRLDHSNNGCGGTAFDATVYFLYSASGIKDIQMPT